MVRRLPAPGTLSPTYFLFAASQSVGTLLSTALAGAPLDPAGYALYSALRETQPTSPTDLARHLGMPATTVLDAVGAMQQKGHVARLRNPRDGRSYLLRLTDEGEQVHDATHQRFSEVDALLSAQLGKDRSPVTTALQALKAASDAALAELRTETVEDAG